MAKSLFSPQLVDFAGVDTDYKPGDAVLSFKDATDTLYGVWVTAKVLHQATIQSLAALTSPPLVDRERLGPGVLPGYPKYELTACHLFETPAPDKEPYLAMQFVGGIGMSLALTDKEAQLMIHELQRLRERLKQLGLTAPKSS